MKIRNEIVVFIIGCIMLISGMILYERLSIFKENQNIIKEDIESISGTEFAFFVDNQPVNKIPEKSIHYSLDTYKSKCYDPSNGEQLSNVSWDNEKWKVVLTGITNTKTKCELYFDDIYIDETLKQIDNSVGPIPDLGNGRLVPIRIDSSSGTPIVKKASIFEKWYSYAEREWANAVILRDGVEDNYKPEELIPEENIESYFVWIPRYEYEIWNGEEETNKFNFNTLPKLDGVTDDELNKQKIINIKFVNKNQSIVTGSTTGASLTHPAFTSFDSNGFWVGKFETSKIGNVEDNSISPESVRIKPNVASWRNIQIANAFYTSYNYQRELDSHMMKNMEWGAVAYLTNSKYGRCSENGICTEVRINNNSDYITGMSATNVPTCGLTSDNRECNQYGTTNDIVNSYNNLESVHSSTTDNYYGVFDMVGGVGEYIMGMMKADIFTSSPASGRNSFANTGFKGPYSCATCDNGLELENTTGYEWPSSKYYDLYDYGMRTNYTRGHFGDGTKEIGPMYSIQFASNVRYVGSWYADVANFADKDYPWIRRGGKYSDGTDSGIFLFDFSAGSASSNYGFRIVLSP